MPWARAVVNIHLGAALMDYWSLSPLELTALAKASKNELTEAEQAEREKIAQKQMAAQLAAAAAAAARK